MVDKPKKFGAELFIVDNADELDRLGREFRALARLAAKYG